MAVLLWHNRKNTGINNNVNVIVVPLFHTLKHCLQGRKVIIVKIRINDFFGEVVDFFVCPRCP